MTTYTPEQARAIQPMSEADAAAIRSTFDPVPEPRAINERILALYHSSEPLTPDEWAEWDRLSNEGNG